MWVVERLRFDIGGGHDRNWKVNRCSCSFD